MNPRNVLYERGAFLPNRILLRIVDVNYKKNRVWRRTPAMSMRWP
jgi:hypothetical protein